MENKVAIMIKTVASRDMQILSSRSDDGYIVKLYEIRLDDCGNLSFDLIFQSQFINGVHSEIQVQNRFVSTQDKLKLNEKLVELIWDDLEKNNHWFCGQPRLKTCNALEFFKYYKFFKHYQSFRSIEFYSLSYFLSRQHSILRNRIERYEKFEDLIDYISYGHREKSVRLALYRNYETSIRWMQRYDPKADMIICRSFDDPNLIRRFINAPIKYELFDRVAITCAIQFLRWLQKLYSPTSIVSSIERSSLGSGSLYTSMWVHTMQMANRMRAYEYNKYFQKVKINKIHDELMRIHIVADMQEINNVVYHYSPTEYHVEITLGHLRFQLVKNTLELNYWGNMLHSSLCMYDEEIINKDCLIIGVYFENVLIYTVAFDGKSILEASGKYNKNIPEYDMEYIEQWVDQATACLKD